MTIYINDCLLAPISFLLSVKILVCRIFNSLFLSYFWMQKYLQKHKQCLLKDVDQKASTLTGHWLQSLKLPLFLVVMHITLAIARVASSNTTAIWNLSIASRIIATSYKAVVGSDKMAFSVLVAQAMARYSRLYVLDGHSNIIIKYRTTVRLVDNIII